MQSESQKGRLGFLFPEEPRSFAGRRGLKIVLRALHVLCVGIFVGAHVLEVESGVRATWFVWTIVSGCALLAIDLHESATALLQVRGLVVLAKLSVVFAFVTDGSQHPWILAAMLVVSVISSHAPSSLRYYMLFGSRRLKGSNSRG